MKRIIGGKRYDTEKAALVGDFYSGEGPRDFRYFSEELFLTPSGAWFLVGRGNALSPYAEVCGNDRYSGVELRPLTPDEAQAWLESRNEVSGLEEHFGHRIADA